MLVGCGIIGHDRLPLSGLARSPIKSQYQIALPLMELLSSLINGGSPRVFRKFTTSTTSPYDVRLVSSVSKVDVTLFPATSSRCILAAIYWPQKHQAAVNPIAGITYHPGSITVLKSAHFVCSIADGSPICKSPFLNVPVPDQEIILSLTLSEY